jgi:anion-transporting  ArsA/GET3 family ATPase
MATTRRTTRASTAELPLGISPRTLFVTGKGGVGKTTVAAAVASAYRDAGVRTLLVEIAGQASAASLISDKPVGYEPVALGPLLHALRIDRDSALREYARLRLKVKLVADRLVSNPIMDQFAQAAPGLPELLVLGKLWQLAQLVDARNKPRYEAIVVDAPATGHGLGLLGMAGVVARMFPVGPIANEARQVDAFVHDADQVAALLVALPEEMPVNETIELHERLGQQGVNVAGVLLNGLLPDRFTDAEADRLATLAGGSKVAAEVRSALDASVYEHDRRRAQDAERARLQAALGGGESLSTLPHIASAQLSRAQVQSLARWLPARGQQVLAARGGSTDEEPPGGPAPSPTSGARKRASAKRGAR